MFETTILISGFCLGLRAITDKDKIGYPLRKLALKLPPIVAKPLLTCCTCMASYWGTHIYWTMDAMDGIMDFSINNIWTWIACVICAAFINELMWALRDWLIGNTPNDCES